MFCLISFFSSLFSLLRNGILKHYLSCSFYFLKLKILLLQLEMINFSRVCSTIRVSCKKIGIFATRFYLGFRWDSSDSLMSCSQTLNLEFYLLNFVIFFLHASNFSNFESKKYIIYSWPTKLNRNFEIQPSWTSSFHCHPAKTCQINKFHRPILHWNY